MLPKSNPWLFFSYLALWHSMLFMAWIVWDAKVVRLIYKTIWRHVTKVDTDTADLGPSVNNRDIKLRKILTTEGGSWAAAIEEHGEVSEWLKFHYAQMLRLCNIWLNIVHLVFKKFIREMFSIKIICSNISFLIFQINPSYTYNLEKYFNYSFVTFLFFFNQWFHSLIYFNK